jgi:hypothetical protein
MVRVCRSTRRLVDGLVTAKGVLNPRERERRPLPHTAEIGDGVRDFRLALNRQRTSKGPTEDDLTHRAQQP